MSRTRYSDQPAPLRPLPRFRPRGWFGQDYTADEDEFLRAILAFRRKHRRTPTLLEGLAIAKSIGWAKEETRE